MKFCMFVSHPLQGTHKKFQIYWLLHLWEKIFFTDASKNIFWQARKKNSQKKYFKKYHKFMSIKPSGLSLEVHHGSTQIPLSKLEECVFSCSWKKKFGPLYWLYLNVKLENVKKKVDIHSYFYLFVGKLWPTMSKQCQNLAKTKISRCCAEMQHFFVSSTYCLVKFGSPVVQLPGKFIEQTKEHCLKNICRKFDSNPAWNDRDIVVWRECIDWSASPCTQVVRWLADLPMLDQMTWRSGSHIQVVRWLAGLRMLV